MTTKCPKCNEEYEVEENSMGSELECSKCDNVFVAKQKLSLKRSIQPAQVAEDEEDEYIPLHLRKRETNDVAEDPFESELIEQLGCFGFGLGIVVECAKMLILGKKYNTSEADKETISLKKGILYFGLLGVGTAILTGICLAFTPLLGIISPISGFLFGCISFFLFDTLMLFVSARILGHEDVPPNMAISAELEIIRLTVGAAILLLLCMFIPVLNIVVAFSAPIIFLLFIPIKVYHTLFNKTILESFILCLVKNIFTSIVVGFFMGIFFLLISILNSLINQ